MAALAPPRGFQRRWVSLCLVFSLNAARGKPADPLLPRVVFHLQDPIDGLCLGPHGFAPCDTTTLWTVGVASGRQSIVSFLHPSEEVACLERVQVNKFDSRVKLGSCKASNTLKWNIKPTLSGSMVTSDDNKHCVTRHSNLAAMQPCEYGYTSLAVVESTLHERGFLLATKDGTCFDGMRFRLCDPKDYKLYWGAAVRYDSPRAEGYYSLFKFHQLRTEPGQKCLARESTKRHSPTVLADCASPAAKWWAFIDGKLTHDHGKLCLKRDDKTGAAKLMPCKEGFTPIAWVQAEELRGRF